jgi:hypothetical protein
MQLKYKKKSFAKALPPGFIHPTQSEAYLRASFSNKDIVILNQKDSRGVLCDVGFFKVEYFTGDKEPEKSSSQGFGLQIWHRTVQEATTTWWMVLPRPLRRSSIAVIDLENQPSENYWEKWDQHGRRYRKRWLEQSEYCIESVTSSIFLEAYKECTLSISLREIFSASIERHERVYRGNAHFYVVKNTLTKEIIAGLLAVDDFETNQSFHPVAFIVPLAKQTQASLGLMDHWIQETKRKNIRFVNLGIVWMPLDPPSWKGYSQFKMHFHPKIILFQRPLFRFFWNH